MKEMIVKTESLPDVPSILPVVFLNPANGRLQLGFPASDGTCAAPIFDFEPQGGKWQLLAHGSPQGPIAIDANDGKVLVSR